MENPQVFQHDRELGEGQEVKSELVVASSEPATFLEPADGTLDAVAFAIGLFVKAFSQRLGLIGFTWNDRFDAAAIEELADRFVAVSLVTGNWVGPADVAWPTHGVHYVVELRRFVRLARGELDGEHKALSVSNHVEL